MPRVRSALLPLFALGALSACTSAMLTREPPEGQLQEGQTVLVDDGACPPGQVKMVTGGSNRSARGAGLPRTRGCVARPADR